MTADLGGLGTAEERWQAWPALREWPELSLQKPPATVVAVAPHPDDEVLGIGGLLALLAGAGSRIHLVAVTDGEGSHPHSPTITPEALGIERAAESTRALSLLGVIPVSTERLGLPDGDVGAHEAESAAVTNAVLQLLARTEHLGPAWCLIPWPADGHPDHEAAGAAALRGASGTARVLSYPVWMWHWATPGDPRVPWSLAHRVVIPADVRAAKRAAIDEFRSQVDPLSDDPADAAILPPPVLRRLTRDFEVVFEMDQA